MSDSDGDNFYDNLEKFLSTPSNNSMPNNRKNICENRVEEARGLETEGAAKSDQLIQDIDDLLSDEKKEEKNKPIKHEGLNDDDELSGDFDFSDFGDDNVAVDMDMFAEELDSSILYTTTDEDFKKFKNTPALSTKTRPKPEPEPDSESESQPKARKIEIKPKSEKAQVKGLETGLDFRGKAELIKQRYYERAIRKWKNTTNFAEGYSIPALATVRAPRLWQDRETKKYFGGEDHQEWADNNHPMWEEWRREEGNIVSFIHKQWGDDHCIDIARNLTKFSSSVAAISDPKLVRNKTPNHKRKLRDEIDSAEGHLVDENEVLSILFSQVESTDSDPEDDDEKDNIYSTLEVRPETRAAAAPSKELELNLTGREICGYCEKVCLCSVGLTRKSAYLNSGTTNVKQNLSVSPAHGRSLLMPEFQDKALKILARLCSKKMSNDEMKNKYIARSQSFLKSIEDMFVFGSKFPPRGTERRLDGLFSEAQALEMLSVEMVQDEYNVYYDSPYNGEDRLAKRPRGRYVK